MSNVTQEQFDTASKGEPSPMAPIMKFFSYDHLPAHLQEISRPFCELAKWIDSSFPPNAETSTSLRKILEAKDCAVRAKL